MFPNGPAGLASMLWLLAAGGKLCGLCPRQCVQNDCLEIQYVKYSKLHNQLILRPSNRQGVLFAATAYAHLKMDFLFLKKLPCGIAAYCYDVCDTVLAGHPRGGVGAPGAAGTR